MNTQPIKFLNEFTNLETYRPAPDAGSQWKVLWLKITKS